MSTRHSVFPSPALSIRLTTYRFPVSVFFFSYARTHVSFAPYHFSAPVISPHPFIHLLHLLAIYSLSRLCRTPSPPPHLIPSHPHTTSRFVLKWFFCLVLIFRRWIRKPFFFFVNTLLVPCLSQPYIFKRKAFNIL